MTGQGTETLEIIITHWQEDWSVCSKMFQSLNIQRGMSNGEIRITIVQDGEEGALEYGKIMRTWPFVSGVVTIPHGGISAARNAGLDQARGEWILFCDCDDLFYSADSLRTMLEAIRECGERSDLIQCRFWIEQRDERGTWFRTKQGTNFTFTHGKIWRRAWLQENGLRFPEGMDYSEDSYFCSEASLILDPKRMAELKEPVYMWCLRGGSCTSDRRNGQRNRIHLARHRVLFPETCLKRGRPDEALLHAGRGILDSWWETTADDLEPEDRQEIEEIIRPMIRTWGPRMKELSPEDRKQLEDVSAEAARRKKLTAKNRPGFETWIRNITKGGSG